MKLVTGLHRPVQERTFVPDAADTEGYSERAQLVSSVKVIEEGPDARCVVYTRGFGVALGSLRILSRDLDELLVRLFREPPKMDRELFQKLMDELEDSIAAGDANKRTLIRRQLLAALDTMSADLAALAGR